MPENFNIADAENSIFKVAQRIPFPGKRKLAAAAAGEEARAMAHGVDTAVLDVELAVKRAYWTLWRAHRRLAVYEQERAIAERVARTAEGRYAASGVPQADVLRAQVGLTHAVTDAKTGGARRRRWRRADLNALLEPIAARAARRAGRSAPRGWCRPTTTALVASWRCASGPRWRCRTPPSRGSSARLELARKAYLPDVELSVSRFINAGALRRFRRHGGGDAADRQQGQVRRRRSRRRTRASCRPRPIAGASRTRVRRDVEQAWLQAPHRRAGARPAGDDAPAARGDHAAGDGERVRHGTRRPDGSARHACASCRGCISSTSTARRRSRWRGRSWNGRSAARCPRRRGVQ